MSILRAVPCGADSPHEVKGRIRYLADPMKNLWQGESYVGLPGRLRGCMLPDDPEDLDAIYHSFMVPHSAYDDVRSGHRLFYHLFMDFGGLLSPEHAVELGWHIAAWFRQFHVQYLQGLHCIRYGKNGLDPVFWPHVHWLVSTRMLDGSGKKLHIGKPELNGLKVFANTAVLIPHGLPPIKIRKEYKQ